MNIVKNLCKIRYRRAYENSSGWVNLDFYHTGATLEINDERTAGGVVYHCSIKTAALKQEVVWEQQPLVVECTLADGRVMQIGSENFPAEMRSSLNLNQEWVEFECDTIYKPEFTA